MKDIGHVPVLPKETVELLDPQQGDVIVDLTAGRGGHAELLVKHAVKPAHVILFDVDQANLTFATKRIQADGIQVSTFNANFATAAVTIQNMGLRADCVFADLGFASNQMDDPQRGFSFMEDGPLDMRLDMNQGSKASDLIQNLDEKELAALIFHQGEDPFARQIARKIVLERQKEPILGTARLAQIVRDAYGSKARTSRLHPATRTFMALRITVNDELTALDTLLQDVTMGCRKAKSDGWLNQGARVAVISFHSLEDRRVKQSFNALLKQEVATRITRKPIRASEDEITQNVRSRPAKLRAIKVLPEQ